MARKYRWLRIAGLLLGVVFFFLIVNSFFRENNRLLAERNAWQEKTASLTESNRELQEENKELQQIIDQGKPGLIITMLDFEPVAFLGPNRLTYQLTITVANRSRQSIPAGSGDLLFALRLPGAESVQRTLWQRLLLPAFAPGEVKNLPVSGELAATPGEELLLLVNLNQQPGVAKVQVRLADPKATTGQIPE